MKTIAIFAGNKREFDFYCQEIADTAKSVIHYATGSYVIDGTQYIYIREPDKIRGLRNFTLVRIGTWRNRSERDLDLLDVLETMASVKGDIKSE